MSENNHAHPDARHLISVARNLLWRAHKGFMDTMRHPGPPPEADSYEISTTIKAAIAIIDGMRPYIAQHEPVLCKNTTMPPGTDNAWQHFLEHVQACYLPPTLTDSERATIKEAAETPGEFSDMSKTVAITPAMRTVLRDLLDAAEPEHAKRQDPEQPAEGAAT
ncbi:hypothetical protein EBZ39_01535 [bacterium]|nr:hypothetical protein [bacterium]